MPSTKQEKINRLAHAPEPQAPLPEWPQLPAFLKTRFPDHAEEIDAYNAACLQFFKRTGTIANG